MEMVEPKLRWSGNQEAQKQADDAFSRLADKPKKKKNKSQARRKRDRERSKQRGYINYREYIPSPKWKRKRKKAFKHYGRVCSVCGVTGVTLYVHHKTYRNLGHEPMDDLQILCVHCHENAHADKIAESDPISKRFREMMA